MELQTPLVNDEKGAQSMSLVPEETDTELEHDASSNLNEDENDATNATSSKWHIIPLPLQSVSVLEKWFENQKKNPYPDKEEKQALVKASQLTLFQVIIN